MTAIELYKFIQGMEWRYDDNNGIEDVLIFPLTFQIDDFYKILPSSIFDDGGLDVTMMDGYFAIWMRYICEYNGIELEEVFDKEKQT